MIQVSYMRAILGNSLERPMASVLCTLRLTESGSLGLDLKFRRRSQHKVHLAVDYALASNLLLSS
jgi:hypothetical protein